MTHAGIKSLSLPADPVVGGRAGEDSRLLKRLTGLWRLVPLLEMIPAAAKNFTGEDGQVHDVLSLAVHATEHVVSEMGISESGGASEADVVASTAALAAKMHPDDGRAVHIAQWVTGWLLNDRSGGRSHRLPIRHPATGEERVLDVRLLYRTHSHTGDDEVLKASNELVNALYVALDVDLADATVANEAVLDSQLRSGRIDAALDSASAAAQTTRAYAREIRSMLDATWRNIGALDWAEEVPNALGRAKQHIDERVAVEDRLIATADEVAENLQGPESDAGKYAKARRIAAVVAEYRIVHRELLRDVMAARPGFLDAQLAQRFGLTTVPLPDLAATTLPKLLRRTTLEAAGMLDTFRATTGMAVPPVVTIEALGRVLLAPRRRHVDPIVDDDDVLVPIARPVVFDDDAHDTVDLLIAGLTDGDATLSALLHRTTTAREADLLVLAALAAFGTPEEDFRASEAGVALAADTHTGDDLLLHRRRQEPGEREGATA